MTKHKIHKKVTKKQNQKGGDLFNPFTWFEGENWGGWFSNVGTKAKETTSQIVNSTNQALGAAATNITSGAENIFKSAGNVLNTNVSLTDNANSSIQPIEPQLNPIEPQLNPIEPQVNPVEPQVKPVEPQVKPVEPQELSIGGRKKRRKYTLKGGKGLGLTYYATPVANIKVASPTYWQVYANGTNQYNIKGGSRRKRKRKTRHTRRRKH